MRLFAQVLTGITLVTLVSFGGARVAREVIVKPQLQELQDEADRQDLRRVLQAIDGRQQQLVALAFDRAVIPRTSSDQTLPPADTFITLNIDYFGTFNHRDAARQWVELAPRQATFTPSSLPLTDVLPYLGPRLNPHADAPIFSSGLMPSQHGPLLYAVATNAQLSVWFATNIDDEFVRDLSEAARLSARIEALPADHAMAVTNAVTNAATSLAAVHRDTHDQIRWVLNDTLERPVAILTLTLPPRPPVESLTSTPLVIAFLIALIGSCLILGLAERMLILPIRALSRHLQRVREMGDYSLRLRLNSHNEIGDINRELNALVEQVQTQQLQLIAQSREMQTLSYQDSLTMLANRRRFDQALADNWAMAQRQRKPLALIMCDVDYFKSYNDHYGHQKGDEVLRQLAQIIAHAVVRTSDLATRYGGEEFAILLPDTTEAGAQHLASQLQKNLQAANIPHEYSHICQRLTLSMGIAALTPDAEQSARDLVRLADEALYAAKAAGRNRIELATELT